MMDQELGVEKRNTVDSSFYHFKMKMFVIKTMLNSIWIWLCAPAFAIPIILALKTYHWTEILLWTVGSYFMTCIAILLIGYPIAIWYNRQFVKNYWWILGDKVIFVHRGVFSRHLARVPYNRIQNVNWRQSLFERWNGFYRIEIETAGSTRVLPEGLICGIKDPEPIIKEISTHIQNNRIDLDMGDTKTQVEAQISGSIRNEDLLRLLHSIDNNLRDIKKLLEKNS